MTLRFLGNYTKLKKCVLRTDVTGQWREFENQQMQFRTGDGAVLNWWETTGTVTFQGREQAIRKFRKLFVQAASKKGFIENESATDEEISGLKRQVKRMQVDIDELKEVVARI